MNFDPTSDMVLVLTVKDDSLRIPGDLDTALIGINAILERHGMRVTAWGRKDHMRDMLVDERNHYLATCKRLGLDPDAPDTDEA